MSRWLLLGLSLIALAALIACAIVWPHEVAGGWLAGFDFWAAIPLGAVGIGLIHRLCGGAWGAAIAPALEGAVRGVTLLWCAIIPVLIAIPTLFLWAGGAHARPDVLANYLNWPFYVGRSFIILFGFSLLGIWYLRGRVGTALAAGGLVFYAVALTVAGIDWVLAVQPQTFMSAFGLALGTEYLTAALAWCILMMPQISEKTRSDLAVLMLCGVLLAAYFNYMDFMVLWYGDVPQKIAWYIARAAMPWKPFAVAGIFFGAGLPALALALGRARILGDLTRPASLSVLIGYACWQMWRVLPGYGTGAIAFALTALIGIGAFVGFLTAGRYPHTAEGRANV